MTPMRPSTPSSGSASRIATAARNDLSASSSCTTGTPKTAITASPMNFSTEPPCCSTIAFMRSKYRARTTRSASGSRRSPSSVDPVTSQKRTVTTFRASRDFGAATGVPQNGQKTNSPESSLPQPAQVATGRV
jgi:hypothetical protein